MRHSRIKLLGLVALAAGTSMGYPQHSAVVDPQYAYPGHAAHGLRVFVDPDTGQYTRPREHAPRVAYQANLSTRAFQPAPPAEIRSSKVGGGFSIDLQARFRPNRRKPDRTQAGS